MGTLTHPGATYRVFSMPFTQVVAQNCYDYSASLSF